MRAIAIGECMVELRSAGGDALSLDFSGDAYNTAVHLKRMAPEIGVSVLTVVGEDPFSLAMRRRWRAEGVEDALAWTETQRRPGLYLIETDASGERTFHYWRGESAARLWWRRLQEAGGASVLAGADLVYLSGISLAILAADERRRALDMLRSLKGRVGLIAFDPNIRPALWSDLVTARAVVEDALAIVDVFLPSDEDLSLLYGQASAPVHMERLVQAGVQEIALTAGPGRCLVHGDGVGWVEGPAAERVVDTTGAGDAFNGAYLAARLRGAHASAAAREGLALAAKTVAVVGAIPPRSARSPSL